MILEFFRRSLLARIVSSFFILSFLIVALLTVFSFTFLARNSRRQLVATIEAIASMKVATLNQWVDEQVQHTTFLAGMADVREPAAALCQASAQDLSAAAEHRRLERFFAGYLAHFPEIRSVSILSAEGGLTVFSTEQWSEGRYRVLDTEFTEGMKKTSIQPVHPSPVTLEPTMSISTPIRDVHGAVVGVLTVDLNLDSMDRIIKDRAGLGATSEVYLVDRFNSFVSGARFGRANYPRGVHSAGIDAALRGESGTGMYLNYAGIPVIASYRWIAERQMALLVEVHRAEALRPALRQTMLLVAIGLSLVLALGFGVFLLARRLAEPILAIQQAALKVSSGNLDAAAPVLTRDEVGVLAQSFNRMTSTVRRLYQEIKEREAHFRSLIESSMDVVVVVNRDLTCSYASPSVERILGYAPDELLRTSLVPLLHAEDREKGRKEYAEAAARGDSLVLGLTMRLLHRDGTWRTMEINLSNRLEDPAIQGYVVNARDVTERQLLEEKLAQAQKMEAVGRLAGGVAHDFNNLLTVVMGYVGELGLSDDLPPAARASVAEIGKAATRAAGLTHQLLAYSRKQVLQPRTINLNDLLAGMTGMLTRLIGEDITIVMRPAPDLAGARADPNQVVQVIMNLAANARDAMPHGGTITFETSPAVFDAVYCRRFPDLSPGDYMMLAVSDTGSGMNEETRQRLFEPFFTTKGVGKGTGLGLATVYGIVRQSGGHVTVSSEVGRGSTFRVYLPAAETAEVEERGAPEAALSRGRETILVVEDEDPVRTMICSMLERAGYSVNAASGAEEAIPKAADMEHIDLLVTDVILPGPNGKEIAEAVRRFHPSMRVLFISGYAQSAIDDGGGLPPHIAFLQKPFTPLEFTRRVREALDA